MIPTRSLHSFALALLLAGVPLSAHASDASPVADVALAPAVAEAAAVVDAFSAALKAGRLDEVRQLLSSDVQVYEGGHVEASRDAYFAGHAAADAAFLATAEVTREARTGGASGDTAWVATRSVIARDGKHHASIETMVLRREAAGWRIVHIHWSSRAL